MRLLLTRPKADSEALAGALEALGHETLAAPLLAIRFLDDATIPLRNWQALLVTSANGAKALARRAGTDSLKNLPVFAVGPASGAAMMAEGFTDVRAAGGDVDSLARLVEGELAPGGGPLLHVAGSVVAGDLRAMLGAQGFDVERCVLYRAEKTESLPKAAADAFRAGLIDGVLLYSPRTAGHFSSLVRAAGLEDKLGGVTFYCLSQAVCDALKELPVRGVKIAPTPDQASLLALISG